MGNISHSYGRFRITREGSSFVLGLLNLAKLADLLQNLAQHQRIVVHVDRVFPGAIFLPECHRLGPDFLHRRLGLLGYSICAARPQEWQQGVSRAQAHYRRMRTGRML